KVYIPKMCILKEPPHSIAMRYVQATHGELSHLSPVAAPASEGPNGTQSSVSVDNATPQPGSYYGYNPNEAISPRVLHSFDQSQVSSYTIDSQDGLLSGMLPGQNTWELDESATSPVS